MLRTICVVLQRKCQPSRADFFRKPSQVVSLCLLRPSLPVPPQFCPYGSKLTPAPYEKAQTSEETIYMQAIRSSRQLSTEVLRVPVRLIFFSFFGGLASPW